MRINLNEIPAEGRSYVFDHKSGELNESLADLLGGRPYEVEFTLKPLGNTFSLKGFCQTKMPEVCSLCGWDLELPIRAEWNEILIEDKPEHRKVQGVHGNQSIDFLNDSVSVTYYNGDHFEAGEFVHEAIAISEPIYPSCGDENCEHLQEARAKQNELQQEFAKAEAERRGHPAFEVLENLKSGLKRQ